MFSHQFDDLFSELPDTSLLIPRGYIIQIFAQTNRECLFNSSQLEHSPSNIFPTIAIPFPNNSSFSLLLNVVNTLIYDDDVSTYSR